MPKRVNLAGGFFIGLHHPNHVPHFPKAMVSVNTLVNYGAAYNLSASWIMDSGAFTQISTYGRFIHTIDYYARVIRWWYSASLHKLIAAVTQDYMCEAFILAKTGLTVREHQRLTIQRFDALTKENLPVYLLPVLQGYSPQEYVTHLKSYGDRLAKRAWVGVGSVCKRNGKPEKVYEVLDRIKSARPDLRLHGFGIKITSLKDERVLSRLHSCDSAAWSYGHYMRGDHHKNNSLQEALRYYRRVEEIVANSA